MQGARLAVLNGCLSDDVLFEEPELCYSDMFCYTCIFLLPRMISLLATCPFPCPSSNRVTGVK